MAEGWLRVGRCDEGARAAHKATQSSERRDAAVPKVGFLGGSGHQEMRLLGTPAAFCDKTKIRFVGRKTGVCLLDMGLVNQKKVDP